MLSESLLIALLGGGAGLFVARVGVKALIALGTKEITRRYDCQTRPARQQKGRVLRGFAIVTPIQKARQAIDID
jgi:hypothetical protein